METLLGVYTPMGLEQKKRIDALDISSLTVKILFKGVYYYILSLVDVTLTVCKAFPPRTMRQRGS